MNTQDLPTGYNNIEARVVTISYRERLCFTVFQYFLKSHKPLQLCSYLTYVISPKNLPIDFDLNMFELYSKPIGTMFGKHRRQGVYISAVHLKSQCQFLQVRIDGPTVLWSDTFKFLRKREIYSQISSILTQCIFKFHHSN